MPHGLKVLAEEPDVDSIVMVSDSRDDSPMVPTQYTQYLAETAQQTTKPCYFMNTRPGLFRQEFADSLRSAGVPTIGGTRQGLGAIDRLARWSAPRLESLAEPPPTARVAAYLDNRNRQRSHINEADSKKLLGEAGPAGDSGKGRDLSRGGTGCRPECRVSGGAQGGVRHYPA